MRVIKIGGSVLKNHKGLLILSELINTYSKEKIVIVISAFAKSTKTIEIAARCSESGDLKKAINLVDELINEHTAIIQELGLTNQRQNSLLSFINEFHQQIGLLLRGINITKELTNKTLDKILSYGEYIALEIISSFLKDNKYDFYSIDATEFIITDSNHCSAKPILDITNTNIINKIQPLLDRKNIVITQGFVAKDENDEITTMGIESSNLTSLLIANGLNAEDLTIWTDVEGFRSADPKIVKKTKNIATMSYDDAYIASQNGFKLIYPSMLYYLKEKEIPIIYKSAFAPKKEFSVITNSDTQKNSNIPLFILSDEYYHLSICFNTNFQKYDFLKHELLDLLDKQSSIITIIKNDNIEIVTKENPNRYLNYIKAYCINKYNQSSNTLFDCLGISNEGSINLSSDSIETNIHSSDNYIDNNQLIINTNTVSFKINYIISDCKILTILNCNPKQALMVFDGIEIFNENIIEYTYNSQENLIRLIIKNDENNEILNILHNKIISYQVAK